MNYYQHHIGDCAKEIGGMSALEVGIYALLRDWYYDAEQPIPASRVYRIARANSDVEKAAVDVVLSELFRLENGIWRKPDIDAQIEDANRRINTARANGAKGGRPKKTASAIDGQPSNIQPGTHPVLAALDSQTGCKAHQSPITNHQPPPAKPVGIAGAADVVGKKKRQSQLPDDFAPNEAGIAAAVGLALETELDAFKNYHAAKGTLMLDWQAAWRTWCGNARKFARPAPTARTSNAASKHAGFEHFNYREGINNDGSFV